MDELKHKILLERIIEDNKEKYENLEREFSTYDWIRYDICGNAISYALWNLLKEIEEYFLIAKDIQDGYSILTLWFGMPHEMFTTEISNDYMQSEYINVIAISSDTYLEAISQHEKAGFMIDQKMLNLFFPQEHT